MMGPASATMGLKGRQRRDRSHPSGPAPNWIKVKNQDASGDQGRSGLWLVHRRLRYAQPERGYGTARQVGVIRRPSALAGTSTKPTDTRGGHECPAPPSD
jgi:hypothetical protein